MSSYREAILPPPPLPSSGNGGASASPTPLSCVLLDDRGYIADDRRNHTTAYATTRDGGQFHASFFLADPPLVSYFCVSHPRAVGPSSKSAAEFRRDPYCIASEAGLVLLSANHSSFQMQDYYAGLLRYGGDRGGYIIAVLQGTAYVGLGPTALGICIFDSKTNAWSKRPAAFDKQPRWQREEVRPKINSVITIGGTAGTMAFVEPNGIIFCDVLTAESPVPLRYVPFPPSFLTNEWISHHRITSSMAMCRDVAVVRGRIRYIEIEMYIREVFPFNWGCGVEGVISDGWTAVMWSMADYSGDWHKDAEIHSHEVSTVDDDGNTVAGFELLPTLRDDNGTPQPTLERMHIGHPTISLCDDDVVYLIAKVERKDPEGWVIALDTRKKRLQGVVEYPGTARHRSLEGSYTRCTISQYLSVAPVIVDEAQPTKRRRKRSTRYPQKDWVTR
ncbi:unnamed protein product [Alopecurus aequalis]